MKTRTLRRSLAALSLVAVLPFAACGTDAADTAATSGSATSTTTDSTATDQRGPGGGPGGPGGPGDTVDVSSVSSEADLVALVQEAYGDASLGLHRGHQPVEDVLDEVLQISHDELHVRMEEQGQNLAAVATDLGIDPQTLIDALVDSWSPAVDNALAAGSITEDQAAEYLDALEEAFTYRVTWDGSEATPTFSGIDA
ncbi:MAG: hypothetical protein OSB43_05035 [Nocardioides sp.]|uniref:hypothetical protein n=1 Tax=Nocardioides sp. TaxID=35761 RepID=UPI0023A48C08|nr:hypothetical protein [Nocardioides sp.]MDE0775623.1 hypothetical protein [Nocardioides sp.]